MTARSSAFVFASWLVARGYARRPRGEMSPWPLRAFTAFVAMHTVHFSMVVTLAYATGGANIAARGGWAPNVVVAAIFYGAVGTVLAGEIRERAGGDLTRAARIFRGLVATGLWIAFLQAYALRAATSWLYAAIAVVLIAAFACFMKSGSLEA